MMIGYILCICIIFTMLYVVRYMHDLNNDMIKIIFYNKNDACDIYQKYHSIYFNNFGLYEGIIKKCDSYKCNNIYCDQTQNFTQKEKNNILSTLKKIKKIINLNIINPKINFSKIFTEWKFIKVTNIIEDGMPHTINDTIILSQKFLDELNENMNNNEKLIKEQGTTLIHEYIHVIQKQNPNIFNKLYFDYWNFRLVDKKILKTIDTKNKISNPDGLYNDMCFKLNDGSCMIPIITLKSSAKKISDFEKIGILMKNDKIIKRAKLSDPIFYEYNSFFKNTVDNYHPNELSAGYISELLLNDYHNHNLDGNAIKKLISWINKYFVNI